MGIYLSPLGPAPCIFRQVQGSGPRRPNPQCFHPTSRLELASANTTRQPLRFQFPHAWSRIIWCLSRRRFTTRSDKTGVGRWGVQCRSILRGEERGVSILTLRAESTYTYIGKMKYGAEKGTARCILGVGNGADGSWEGLHRYRFVLQQYAEVQVMTGVCTSYSSAYSIMSTHGSGIPISYR